MNKSIKQVRISTEDFSPKVLKSSFFAHGKKFPHGHKLQKRYVYDYELEFFVESSSSMWIEDKLYPIYKGDIVFRKPGQFTQGIMPYCCYSICIDLLGNTGKSSKGYGFYKKQNFQNYYLNTILEIISSVYHPPATEKYHYLFDTVLKEFINSSKSSPLLLKSYVLQILYQLYQDVENSFVNTVMPLSPHYVTLKKVIKYIKQNTNANLNLNQLASVCNLSPNYFHKIFTETLGITPNEFVTNTRLNHAKELLVKTNASVADIAVKCGFDNIPYFSFLFKKKLGISPGEFRKKYDYIYTM